MFELCGPTLGELFEKPVKFFAPTSSTTADSYKYCVPAFQRKYEWEKEKEVGPLINDISSNMNRQYFIGPMILFPRENHDEVKIEIVDGQQRLATFALYFRAFADYLQSRIDDHSFLEQQLEGVRQLKADIRRMFIRRKEKTPVIQLSDLINRDFEAILLDENPQKNTTLSTRKKKGEHVSIRNIKACYLKVYEHLQNSFKLYREDQLYRRLDELFQHLDNNLRIAVIKVNSYSDAYTMYETMNAKAKRLTLSDLAKIVVFQKLALGKEDSSEVKDLEESWDKAESKVSDFSSFIWHVWVSSKPSCPKKDVYYEMERHFKKINREDAKNYVYETVLYEADWYQEYENPNEIEDEKCKSYRKEYLGMLKVMAATRCYPLLLSIDHCLSNKILNTNEANDLLQKIVCLTFWHNGICELDAKPLESLYHELALYLRQQFPKEKTNDAVKHVLTKLSERFPTKERCTNNFIIKNFEDTAFTKMILRTVENRKYRDKEKELRSNTIVWLEHVLPQNPRKDSEWIKIFPNSDDREDQCTRLGNCTLLYGPTDIELSNKDFSKKKPRYKDSEVGITREISNDYNKWDAESIKKRTEMLARFVEEIWPIG